ncbi:MAG: FliH/SctL family protein [Myxococcota bacterium]
MGRVIKGKSDSGESTPEPRSAPKYGRNPNIITADKAEAKQEAQGIRERAVDAAQQIIEQAHQEAAEILEQARQQGEELRREAQGGGYEAGRAQAASELSEIIARGAMRMQQIEEQAVPQLKDLALRIARKVLGRELEFHPDATIDIVKQALAEKARQRREIFLRVNPDDLAIIRERKSELLEVLSRCKDIGIREDPDVSRYGVIIETDAGTIDAQLDTQLAVFERVLKEMG